MTDPPDPEELARLGVYDPDAADAEDRLALIGFIFERGGSVEDLRRSLHWGELALDLHLRPRLDLTLRQAVDEIGLDWSRAVRLRSALGQHSSPDERVTAKELAALRLLDVASRELLGEEMTVQLARVSGTAMARIAEALVTAIRLQFELPRLSRGSSNLDVLKEYAVLAETLLPPFLETLDGVLRREIVGVAERMWSTDEEQSVVTLPRTVGFADLVGYTAVASAMSVRQLTAVLLEFDERVAEIVGRHRGQVIKTIGDEALFVTEDPMAACRIGLELVDEFGGGALPPVRVGLASGDVVSVLGDVYGPTVNLASRLVGATQPSTVLVSDEVRSACGEAFVFAAVEPLALKGFVETVSAFVASGRMGR